MSSSSSSSVCRRLHGLFNLHRSSATKTDKPPFVTIKPKIKKATATAAATTTNAASDGGALTAERRLQKLVSKFKKKCDSPHFRAKHGIYDATVRRLAFQKKFSLIEDIVESQKKYEDIKDEGFAIRLIMLYGKSGMFSHARKLFDDMPELNCERTVKSFNALLASCVNSKEYDQVETIFRELPQKLSIEVNVISYNTVINAFCEMGSMDSALSLFDEMEKNGIEPDLVTFNTLLAAHYNKGQFLDGENLWALMASKDIVPNRISYKSRLRGMVLENRLQQGIELLAEMEGNGIKPDVSSFNTMITGFCGNGDLEETKKWYSKMKENESTAPNGLTYRTIIPFLCEQGDFDMALELCKEAIDNRLIISLAVVQCVVDGLVKLSKIEEATELVQLGNSNKHLNYKLQLPQASV